MVPLEVLSLGKDATSFFTSQHDLGPKVPGNGDSLSPLLSDREHWLPVPSCACLPASLS